MVTLVAMCTIRGDVDLVLVVAISRLLAAREYVVTAFGVLVPVVDSVTDDKIDLRSQFSKTGH